MAYLPTPEDQNQQQGATTAPPGLTTPPPTSTSTGGTGGARTTSAPSSASSTTPGTPATNVGQYLAANGPQVQNFATGVTEGLNAGYNQTTSDINSAGQAFNTSVGNGYTPYNPGVISQVASNPTAAASNPNTVSAFQAQANDQYTGPSQFETTPAYGNLESEIANAQNVATPWESFAGTESQFQTLGDTTPGEQNLDATLISQTPGAASEIQQAAAPYANLNQYLANVAQPLDTAVTNAQQQAQEAQSGATGALTSDEQALQNEINSELATAEGTYQNNASIDSGLSQAVLNGTISPAQAQALGVTPQELQAQEQLDSTLQTYEGGTSEPVNIPTYFTQGTPGTSPTLYNAATPADYAEAAALNELSGGTYAAPIPQSDVSQAGTANAGETNPGFNDSQLAQALLNQSLGDLGFTSPGGTVNGVAQAPGYVNMPYSEWTSLTPAQQITAYQNSLKGAAPTAIPGNGVNPAQNVPAILSLLSQLYANPGGV